MTHLQNSLSRYGYERCGLMIAACYMLEKLKVDREVDVFRAVKQVRIPRPQLVTSLVSGLPFLCFCFILTHTYFSAAAKFSVLITHQTEYGFCVDGYPFLFHFQCALGFQHFPICR